MNRYVVSSMVLLTGVLFAKFQPACTAAEAAAGARPNILWITCEDISPHLGCYGDKYAHTPNLDRLAAQGVRYTRAFATASVCTPVRSCLITGIFASSLGTQHLRGPQPLPKAVRCFTEYLRGSGYYCSNNVKEDYNFATPPGAWDESSPTAHWRKRKPGRPFFSVFNFTTTHQGQVRYSQKEFDQVNSRLSPDQRHDPARVPLPPYYPDTPVVRRIQAQLHTQITLMDKQAGDLLGQLAKDGLAEETIVFFYSDHGTGLPRHKRWLHDSGIRVPLIVHFPKKYQHLAPGKPGSSCDRLVSFVDFPPTVLSLLGLKIPDYMQGRVFLGKQAAEPRRYIFAIRDRVDEVYDCARTVRDQRYQYIRNFMPHRPRMQHSNFSERTPIRQEIRSLAAEGKLHGDAAWLMSPTRPAEELYDTQSDPHEMHNLADSPEHRETVKRMRAALRQWMLDTRDTGLLAEAEMCRRSAGSSPYEMARRPGEFDIQRILDAAELVGKGSGELSRRTELLKDKDSAVRYWAATGLLALGPEAKAAEQALQKALADPAPNVRFAAAEALCRLGRRKEVLPVITAGLRDKDERVRLQAAIVLSTLGELARDATPDIKAALARKNKGNFALYLQWALLHALSGSD